MREVPEAQRPKRVRCARFQKERTGRAGPARANEELAPPAGPKRVRRARFLGRIPRGGSLTEPKIEPSGTGIHTLDAIGKISPESTYLPRPGDCSVAYGIARGAAVPKVAPGTIPAPRAAGYLIPALSTFAGPSIVGFQVPADFTTGAR
ncbi:MAG: hypothetical protein ACK58M_20105 [Acidobacteriota bacterium]